MKRPVRRGAFFALPIVVAGLFFSPLPAHAQETPHPLNADAYFARGTTAHQLGDLQTAIDLFRRAVAKQPGELRFGLKLAATLMEAEQFDQAEHLLGIMKEQHPRSVDVSSLLGRVFARSGNWNDAVTHLAPLEDALFPEDRIALADALIELDRSHEAENVLDRGIEAYSKSRALHDRWIDSAIAQKRFTTALLRCDLAEKRLGQSPELLYRRALAYYFSGHALGKVRLVEVADAAVGKMIHEGLIIASGRQAGKVRVCPPESAIWCVRSALDAGLATIASWTLYARCWQEMGDEQQAWSMIEHLENEIVRSSDKIVLVLAAEVARGAGALDAFASISERRARVDRKQADSIHRATYLALSDEYNLRGDSVMTAAFLRRALELDEENDDLRVALGNALWSSGKTDDAAREYLAVLARKPRHPQRQVMLDRLAEKNASATAREDAP